MPKWLYVIGSFAVLSGILIGIRSCGGRTLSVADVDAMVVRFTPIGATPKQVTTTLDSLQIEHSDYDPHAHFLQAKVTDPHSKGLVTHAFQVKFFFDTNNVLMSHATKEVFTGP